MDINGGDDMTDQELRELAEKAAARLSGSCESLASLGEEYEDAEMKSAFCNRLDELVFCCERCNWWCEISEISDKHEEWICDECEYD
jgi:hypothetical protein